LLACGLLGLLAPQVQAQSCLPMVEVGPSLASGKAPLNTRVWVRMARDSTRRFRRKHGKISVAKVMRAITLTDLSTNKTMKFMLRVDAQEGADAVLSLRPMAAFQPDRRYRVSVQVSESRQVVTDFETGAKPLKAKNPPKGAVEVDYPQSPSGLRRLRARYRLNKAEPVAPLYQVFVVPVGKPRPKKPTTIEFTTLEDDAWSVDVISLGKCKWRNLPKGSRDIIAWLRPLTWYGSAMGPIVGPFRIERVKP
jgi:hypothetical protein